MSNRFSFEDFGRPIKPAEPVQTLKITEDDLTRATESAYQDGWDDCLAQVKVEEGRITEALGRRLAEIRVERAEILAEITAGTDLFLSEVLDKILPTVAQKSFGAKLRELLSATLAESLEPELTLHVSQDELAAVSDLISENDAFETVNVVADPNLGITQVLISHGKETVRFDLMAVLDELDATFAEQKIYSEAANG